MTFSSYRTELAKCISTLTEIRSLYNQVYGVKHHMVVKRKTAIGTPRRPRKPMTPDQKAAVYQELLAIEVDIGQLGKAIGRSDYKMAKKQQSQIVKRLQKVRL